MKTQLRSERRLDNGRLEQNFQVTVMAPLEVAPPVQVAEMNVTTEVGSDDGDRPPPPSGPRIERQLRRMDAAAKHQVAEPGVRVEIDGEPPLISAPLDVETESHWKTLNRLISKARKEGYAAEGVDNAFLYVALYRDDGGDMAQDFLEGTTITADLLESGILFPGEENSVVLYGIPEKETRGAWPSMPYFLYPIPQRAVFDMLYGRLFVFVIVNSNRIVAALEKAGFGVLVPSGRNDLKGNSLVLTSRFSTKSGQQLHGELRNFSYHMLETIHEFRSLQHLIELAHAMRNAAAGVADDLQESV